jgi:hypothetical protein
MEESIISLEEYSASIFRVEQTVIRLRRSRRKVVWLQAGKGAFSEPRSKRMNSYGFPSIHETD